MKSTLRAILGRASLNPKIEACIDGHRVTRHTNYDDHIEVSFNGTSVDIPHQEVELDDAGYGELVLDDGHLLEIDVMVVTRRGLRDEDL